MRIRTITYGLRISAEDFTAHGENLLRKISIAVSNLGSVKDKLIAMGYEVQTLRISFNKLEEWLDSRDYLEQADILVSVLSKFEIVNLVSLGCGTTLEYISLIPQLLGKCQKFVSSVHLPMGTEQAFTIPDYDICLAAANVCLQLSTLEASGGANFRFGIGFNCVPGMPFYPISFHNRYLISFICVLSVP